MRPLLLLSLVVCGAVAPAHAEVGDCEADLEALGSGALGVVLKDVFLDWEAIRPKVSFEEERCVARDVVLKIGSSDPYQQVVRADEIRWTAEWSDATRPFPPTRLLLDASGMWQGIETEEFEAAIAYQMRLVGEAAPFGLTIDYAYDPATERLDLRRFDIGNERDGLSAAMVVNEFRPAAFLTGAASTDDILALRPTQVEIGLRNGIFFETMTGGWLPLIYPRLGKTPEAAVEQAKRVAQTQLNAVPDALMPSSSRSAISEMVESLPHPAGQLQLRMAAPDGLNLEGVAQTLVAGPPTWEGLVDALNGAKLEAQWTPQTGK